jgi:hypothetical protein
MDRSQPFLGLYWWERREALSECAVKVFDSLRLLANAGYSPMILVAARRKGSLGMHELEVSREAVLNQLAKGVNRREIPPREPIPELGWSLSLWSGRDGRDENFQVKILCGCYSPNVPNTVGVRLPSAGPFQLSLDFQREKAVFDGLISIWEPRLGILCDSGTLAWASPRVLASSVQTWMRYEATDA